MQGLKDTFSKLFQAPGFRERFKAWEVLSDWEKLVPPELARRTWPLAFSQGRLTLGVEDHAWAAALRFQTQPLLSLLNQAAGERLFREIKWVVGRPPWYRKRPPRRPWRPLTEKEKARLEDLLSQIEDPELREAFRGWGAVLLPGPKRTD